MLPDIWKKCEVPIGAPSSGDGECLAGLQPKCWLTFTLRSVHNTRIERLWYDLTEAFGRKWKKFFMELEAHHGLNVNRTEHIWLLHHLFLLSIDQDAQAWAAGWNDHKLQMKGSRQRSPRDMFFFGMLQEGLRGVSTHGPADEEVEDLASYGVDWEVNDNEHLMSHLLDNNPEEWEDDNPFISSSLPGTLTEVLCDPPNCPFTEQQVSDLDTALSRRVDLFSKSMRVRRLIWQEALQISGEIWAASLAV